MLHRGAATFTLDDGKCPKWLFDRMVRLGREMTDILVAEWGPDEFIKRISDPVWFQSLGTVLAFDWNASGLTTILTAALKESIRNREQELGIFICGGKGKTSRKTPDEIKIWGERLALPGGVISNLEYNSRMAAKVDSALVQDGFQIYHHSFFFSRSGKWAVVQQGMNTETVRARRYHWYSDNVRDLVQEPHAAIVSDGNADTLNLVARASDKTREISVDLVRQSFSSLMKDVRIIRKFSSPLNQSLTLRNRQGQLFTALNMEGLEFNNHPVQGENMRKNNYLEKILSRLTTDQPHSYEQLVATPGVGPKTVRALALVGEVVYGAKPSYQDPARYSFAFGGKDGTPYPVDRPTYDQVLNILSSAVKKTHLPSGDKNKAVLRLQKSFK